MPVHHTIDYVELGAAGDLAATRAFYEGVFGWTFTDYGPSYAGIRTPDGTGEVGGIDAATTPSPGGPLVLLFSEDLDATAAAIASGGGVVVDGPSAFPGGRRLEFTDPAGNRLGVWASS